MFGFLKLIPTEWIMIGIALVAAYGVGQLHGRGAVYQKWIEANVEASKQAVATIKRQEVVTEKVRVEYVDRIKTIKGETQTIIKEVDRYVPQSADLRLPLGWRLLHDAATVGAVPPPTDGVDVTAPDVAASEAGRAVIGNYGTCRGIAQTLISLQNWVRKEYEATNGEPLGY